MMSSGNPPAAIDIDHLSRALGELGYTERVTPETAPLVHHILNDLKQATTEYADLLQHYDALYAEQKRAAASASVSRVGGEAGEGRGGEGSASSRPFDFGGNASSLDTSMLLGQNVDESFMLQAVERAQGRIDELTAQVEELQVQGSAWKNERDAMAVEVQRTKEALNEATLSLAAKQKLTEALQGEIASGRTLKETQVNQPLVTAIRMAINALPFEVQASYTARVASEAPPEGLFGTLQEVLLRVRREIENQSKVAGESTGAVERLRRQQEESNATVGKLKAGLAQYQAQVAALTARLAQKDFERGLQGDIAAQLAAMEGVNAMLKEKLVVLDKVRREGFAGGEASGPGEKDDTGRMASLTVRSLLESLSGELNTEVCFTSHLNQLIDKLNKRRLEQDGELARCQERLYEAEAQLTRQEMEKAELAGRLEITLEELSKRSGTSASSGEVVANLQQALESKQSKIDEQKRYCTEIKAALDNCQQTMAHMRRNEDMIKKHIQSQDEEIASLKRASEHFAQERTKYTARMQEVEGELAKGRAASKDKAAENAKLVVELREARGAEEKALATLRTSKDRIAELEETVASKRKEKDLLMTTYCRVIKDNEKLHADLQKIQDGLASSRAGDANAEGVIKAFQTKIQLLSQDVERLKGQLEESQAKVGELEAKLYEAVRARGRLEEEERERKAEAAALKGTVASLERSKKDLAAQTARFGQQAADLRGHLRRIEEERNDLQRQLASVTKENPSAKILQSHLAKVSMDLDYMRSQMHALEREKDTVSSELHSERVKSERMEQVALEERNQRLEKERAIQGLERTRNKLREQIESMTGGTSSSSDHDVGRRTAPTAPGSDRRGLVGGGGEASSSTGGDSDNYYEGAHERGGRNRRLFDSARQARGQAPLATATRHQRAASGGQAGSGGGGGSIGASGNAGRPGEDPKTDTNERLLVQNEFIRKHLDDIRREMKETLTPDRVLDLDSSLMAITSDDGDSFGLLDGGESHPQRRPLSTTNAEMRRRLEEENKLLYKIVDKVKSELQRAGMETPNSISSSGGGA